MIALPELHNLIRSLNKPEKRFFKLLSATENFRVDKAIALFDHIEKISDSDDVYFRTEKEARIDVTLDNLNVLYDLILKSQRNFYSETITGFMLNDELANLKILFEKAQYKQCRKMIKSVKESAFEKEKYSYLLEILELEKKLLHTEMLGREYAEQYAVLKKQKQDLIEREKNVGVYYQLYARLRFQIKSKNLKGKKTQDMFFQNFLEDPFIKDSNNALSRKSAFLLMKCRALCHNALKNQEKRCAQLLELKIFMQKDDLIFDEMPRQYIDVLYSLANNYVELGEFADSKKILSEIQTLINSKKIVGTDLYIKARSYAFNVELLLLMCTHKFSEADDLAQTILDYVRENQKIFNKEDKSVLLFNLVNFHIYNNNYSSALKILSDTKTDNDKNSRWDLKAYSRIQEMVVCYELKEYSKFSLAVGAAKKLLKDKILVSTSEMAFVNFFDELAFTPDNITLEKKFKALYWELRSLLKKNDDKWVNFFYFNFCAYAGHKAGEGAIKDLMVKDFVIKEKSTA